VNKNFKEAMARETLNISHALMAVGYYPYKIQISPAGNDNTIVIEGRRYLPVHDDQLLIKESHDIPGQETG
jgi:hypothetical protein